MALTAAAQKRAKLEEVDKMINLPWRQVRNQELLGTEYVIVDLSTKLKAGQTPPTQIDFEYSATKRILFGPMTKFSIKGRFDYKDANAANWEPIPAAEIANVILNFNWFEMLIKLVDVFHNNQRVASSNKQRYISPYLHAMLYHYMDANTKQYLCPQKSHPAYCIPQARGDWNVASQTWKDYAANFFNETAFGFDFFSLFQFPFYLGSNFIANEVSRLIPLHHLGKIQIRFTFFDDQSHIFRKVPAAAAKSYRFVLNSFKLCLEEAHISPSFEREVASKSQVTFPGVTHLQLVESILDLSSTFKTVFPDIFLPEAILIFCLNKQVASGT